MRPDERSHWCQHPGCKSRAAVVAPNGYVCRRHADDSEARR